MADDRKKVFLTVGTTAFDELIKTVNQSDICNVLKELGFSRLLIQKGRGQVDPKQPENIEGFRVEYYQYKESLHNDMQEADLIISHAGAGTCLEVLNMQKPLVVVINEELMGNHQQELAKRLQSDSHLFYTTCKNLPDLLRNIDLSSLKPFEAGRPEKFASFLDKAMGIS